MQKELEFPGKGGGGGGGGLGFSETQKIQFEMYEA